MRHLTLEAVARLVDEAPEPEEALHLRDCLACRRELAEMRAQTEELARLAAPEPSPRPWAALEARLLEEGLVKEPRRTAPPALREQPWMRTAAAVALLVLGGSAGAAVWSGGSGGAASVEPVSLQPQLAAAPEPDRGPPEVAGTEPAPAAAEGIVRTAAAPPPVGPPAGRARAPRPPVGRRTGPGLGVGAAVQEAEREYLRALEAYARAASAEDADPVTRLATLEGMVRATRNALERAPDDPVVNGYHLAAMGQRDVMLRQIARSSEETWY